jgi:hypothetical protein
VKSRLLAAVGIVAVLGAIACVLAAQTPASPAFEVASVKVRTAPAGVGPQSSPDRYTRTNASLRDLICEAINADRIRKGEPPPLPSGPDDLPVCSSTKRAIPSAGGITIRYRTSGTTSGEFAAWLSPYVGRKVVDRTELMGAFDFDVAFNPGGLAASAAPGDEPVSVFTALQEQLGLKLESTKGRVDVLVIDHVEHPTKD